MGLFSWKTQDTDRSIPCEGSSRPTFKVVLHDNKGNKWIEESYEGYGEFGGMDYYELLAEMNGGGDRHRGIDLKFGDKPFIAPNLTETEDWVWRNEEPKNCKYQGFFYDDDDDDDGDE
jgi:hypothetical protein